MFTGKKPLLRILREQDRDPEFELLAIWFRQVQPQFLIHSNDMSFYQ